MTDDSPQPRPNNFVEGGLQYERTALAWERTAIAIMVAGVALARFGATDGHPLLGVIGGVQTTIGAVVLLWASRNGDVLHNPAFPASAVPQVAVARFVGTATIAFTGTALLLAIVVSVSRLV